jgi:hypothetical protein
MANIQKTLDSLQPYVIGIRYLEGTPLVDAVFKEGWTVPDEPNIKKIKGNEEMNYFMIFSEVNGIGLDELLGYVERTIKINQEREKKHDLLKIKVNELKDIFKKTSLSKLSRLKFVFGEEELVPNLNDFDVDTMIDEPFVEEQSDVNGNEEQVQTNNEANINNVSYLDENGNPIEMSEEDIEMLEEEARAERNRQIFQKTKRNPISNAARNVELPPKKKTQMVTSFDNYDTDCDCGPTEACSKCINTKDL